MKKGGMLKYARNTRGVKIRFIPLAVYYVFQMS